MKIIKSVKIITSVILFILLSLMLFVLFSLTLYYCFYDEEKKQDKIMSIDFLAKTSYAEFYLFNNFIDNESCIKHLFDFANNNDGRRLIFVTRKNDVRFDNGIYFREKKSPRFFFTNQDSLKSNNYKVIRVDNKVPNLSFSIKEDSIEKKLTTDFDSLNLNIIQNMLDFARADSAKFDAYNYTYELFNKNNIKKIAIIYHGKGEWFEIEVLKDSSLK